jgi:hypothetical protein
LLFLDFRINATLSFAQDAAKSLGLPAAREVDSNCSIGLMVRSRA